MMANIGKERATDVQIDSATSDLTLSFGSGLRLQIVNNSSGVILLAAAFRNQEHDVKGSDNRYKGEFSKDGNSFKGAWAWPGGGYEVTGIRVK